MNITEAAKFLGIAENTLRLHAQRRPAKAYRPIPFTLKAKRVIRIVKVKNYTAEDLKRWRKDYETPYILETASGPRRMQRKLKRWSE